MRRHFHQFDEELQDSDQTISTPVRHLQPRTRLPVATDTIKSRNSTRSRSPRRQFLSSAFFSDTTDDDVSRPLPDSSRRFQLSTSGYSRSKSIESNRKPFHVSTGPREGRRHSGGQWGTMRLHVDAIQFPATRSVLWDRRRLSDTPASVSLKQVLPRFIVLAETLKDIYTLYQEKISVRGSGDAALCYLYGDATTLRTKTVALKGVKPKKKDALAMGTWCIPVHAIADSSKLRDTQESYVATIAALQSSYRDEYSDNVAAKLQLKLLVLRSNDARLDVQLECVAPSVPFNFSLIRNLPLLMTPLAVSLARREFSTECGNLQSGYLTLDQTRKAVPLLKVDPLVLQLPLVGVWVYGVQIDDAWDEEIARQQLADPLLYFACISYLTSQAIRERVGPEKNTFLVALYPASNPDGGGAVGSLPRFFECKFSELLSPRTQPFPIELYSHRRSCLVGASKFSTDVELTLSAAPTSEWEDARRQAKIPTAPRCEQSKDMAPNTAHATVNTRGSDCLLTSSNKSAYTDGDEHEDSTSGWTITSDAIRTDPDSRHSPQSQTSMQGEQNTSNATLPAECGVANSKENVATRLNNVHNVTCTQAAKPVSNISPSNETKDAFQRDWNDNSTPNYRSCCKTQQLLTIQHQQILENQQRQLHEMQEQIVQLRRLLNTTRSEEKKKTNVALNDEGRYGFDASRSGVGAEADVPVVSSIRGQQKNGLSGSQLSLVSATPRQSDDESFSDKTSVHTHHNDENVRKGDGMDFSLSSLSLSSFSCGSGADLSSLSSSLVSEQPNDRSCSQSQKEVMVDGEQVESGAQGLNQFQSSQYDKKEPNQDRTAQASNIDSQEEELNENVAEAREGTDNSTSSHDLSIDKLSTSSHQGAGDMNASGDTHSIIERLLSPDAYLRKVGGFVDHHGGCFTTPPLDFHSFCVPRIKFSTEVPECDSDEEEIRLIEQKYKRLMAA
ncbi:unnamed protein product [Peronospora belbahrii]|uniref:STIL N-terminal domain-containing protein n=1 Tax=Peronospora belbahrii TaxID=622444 RepID=A0AAU9LNX0_9STRA|nr:unnamed protein product [Peronospora belbahrii]